MRGEWDLRGSELDYLGRVNVAQARVLELGPASGHLSFFMERQGAAEVVVNDLSPAQPWDVVPYAARDTRTIIAERKALRTGPEARGAELELTRTSERARKRSDAARSASVFRLMLEHELLAYLR